MDAIAATAQAAIPPVSPDQLLEAFLLSQRALVVPLNTPGDRNLFEFGRPLGFTMLTSFDGMRYLYFGNFTALRPEVIVWRLKMLQDILAARFGSIPKRVQLGLAAVEGPQAAALKMFTEQLEIWVLVTSDDHKTTLTSALGGAKLAWPVKVFAISDIATALQSTS